MVGGIVFRMNTTHRQGGAEGPEVREARELVGHQIAVDDVLLREFGRLGTTLAGYDTGSVGHRFLPRAGDQTAEARQEWRHAVHTTREALAKRLAAWGEQFGIWAMVAHLQGEDDSVTVVPITASPLWSAETLDNAYLHATLDVTQSPVDADGTTVRFTTWPEERARTTQF